MNTDKNTQEISPTTIVTSILKEEELTGKILEAAFAVHNTLGVGFLERVYSNALALELRSKGLTCRQEQPLKVTYKNAIVGDYIADLVVGNRVLVELKACTLLDPVHGAQLINYLRASGIKVGLLLNFGKTKLQFRRLVC